MVLLNNSQEFAQAHYEMLDDRVLSLKRNVRVLRAVEPTTLWRKRAIVPYVMFAAVFKLRLRFAYPLVARRFA